MIEALQKQFVEKMTKAFNDALIKRGFSLVHILQSGNDVIDISSGREMLIAQFSFPQMDNCNYENKFMVKTELQFIAPVPYIRIPND